MRKYCGKNSIATMQICRRALAVGNGVVYDFELCLLSRGFLDLLLVVQHTIRYSKVGND